MEADGAKGSGRNASAAYDPTARITSFKGRELGQWLASRVAATESSAVVVCVGTDLDGSIRASTSFS